MLHCLRLLQLRNNPYIGVQRIQTATQMLESMIENPRPTRAEASDVANAIYDGTDAVMLSAETAAGKYPVETVAMMAKIVAETEHQIRLDPPRRRHATQNTRLSVAETICECMAHSAEDLELAAIAIFTETGFTARLLSKYRPVPPIFALFLLVRIPRGIMRGITLRVHQTFRRRRLPVYSLLRP